MKLQQPTLNKIAAISELLQHNILCIASNIRNVYKLVKIELMNSFENVIVIIRFAYTF